MLARRTISIWNWITYRSITLWLHCCNWKESADGPSTVIEWLPNLNLQSCIAKDPHWISFGNGCVCGLSCHKSIFPWASSRDRSAIIVVNACIALPIAGRSITLQNWINVHTTFRISRIALIAITSCAWHCNEKWECGHSSRNSFFDLRRYLHQ